MHEAGSSAWLQSKWARMRNTGCDSFHLLFTHRKNITEIKPKYKVPNRLNFP